MLGGARVGFICAWKGMRLVDFFANFSLCVKKKKKTETVNWDYKTAQMDIWNRVGSIYV